MNEPLPNPETEALAHALMRRPASEREIAACVWNMVCEAVAKQVEKPEQTR